VKPRGIANSEYQIVKKKKSYRTFSLLAFSYLLFPYSVGVSVAQAVQTGWTDLGSNTNISSNNPCVANNWNGIPFAFHDTCSLILDAWGGGAWDDQRHLLYLNGGGHIATIDDSVLALDPVHRTITRLWGPATDVSLTSPQPQETPITHQPVSVHTYAGIIYFPRSQILWRYSGGDYDVAQPQYAYVFEMNMSNPSAGWTAIPSNIPEGQGAVAGAYCVVDPTTTDETAVCTFPYGSYDFVRWDRQTEMWTKLCPGCGVVHQDMNGNSVASAAAIGTPVMDPTTKKIWYFIGAGQGSSGNIFMYDTSTNVGAVEATPQTSGCSTILGAGSYTYPGADWDSSVNKIRIYETSGNVVTTFDPATLTCVDQTYSGGPPTDTQELAANNGMGTRFHYSASLGAIVLAPGGTLDGYTLSLSTGITTVPPSPPPPTYPSDTGTLMTYVDSNSGMSWSQISFDIEQVGNKPQSGFSANAVFDQHARIQHWGPPSSDPDLFPYQALKDFETQEVAAGRPPIFATAHYNGQVYPVAFMAESCTTIEQSCSATDGQPVPTGFLPRYAVNVADPRYLNFLIKNYLNPFVFDPTRLQSHPINNWVSYDNGSFRYNLYGIIDSNNIWHTTGPNLPWDSYSSAAAAAGLPAFPTTEQEYETMLSTGFALLKTLDPGLHDMVNTGSLTNDQTTVSNSPVASAEFQAIYANIDGLMSESFEPVGISSTLATSNVTLFSRGQWYQELADYNWAVQIGKAVVARMENLPDAALDVDQWAIRTALVCYLLINGPASFFAPVWHDPTLFNNTGGPTLYPASTWSPMKQTLGNPTGSYQYQQATGQSKGYGLYSRTLQNGIVYLNTTGSSETIPLPSGATYYDHNGAAVTQITIPDMTGDYVTISPSTSPPPGSGGLPTPQVTFGSLPINRALSVANASAFSGYTIDWTFTPVSGSGAPTSALAFRSSAGAIDASGAAIQPLIVGLSLGTYQVSVAVVNGNGTSVASVSGQITFVNADLSSVRIYPNPWRVDKHSGINITFSGLTTGTTIKLFTISGHKVKEVTTDGPSWSWDRTNDNGDPVASGVYIYLITDGQGDKVKGKVAVIR